MTIWLSVIIAIIAILMKVVYKGKGAGAPIPFCSHARKTESRRGVNAIGILFIYYSERRFLRHVYPAE